MKKKLVDVIRLLALEYSLSRDLVSNLMHTQNALTNLVADRFILQVGSISLFDTASTMAA